MTSPPKTKYPRVLALEAARDLCRALKPVTERLVVAGSLRRRKEEVGDVEIVYVPKVERRRTGLFDEDVVEVSLTAVLLDWLAEQGAVIAKRPNVLGHLTWGEANRHAVHLPTGVPVDLFATTEEAWHNYLVCRTGPGESNIRICEEARKRGWKWKPYGIGFERNADGHMQRMESERAVFEFVGLPYLEPWERT